MNIFSIFSRSPAIRSFLSSSARISTASNRLFHSSPLRRKGFTVASAFVTLPLTYIAYRSVKREKGTTTYSSKSEPCTDLLFAWMNCLFVNREEVTKLNPLMKQLFDATSSKKKNDDQSAGFGSSLETRSPLPITDTLPHNEKIEMEKRIEIIEQLEQIESPSVAEIDLYRQTTWCDLCRDLFLSPGPCQQLGWQLMRCLGRNYDEKKEFESNQMLLHTQEACY